jgi:hypothetical protein
MVGDGVGGDKVPLVPDDEDDSYQAVPLAPDDQRFLPRLALLEGLRTTATRSIAATSRVRHGSKPHVHQKPLVRVSPENLDDDDEKERYRLAEKGRRDCRARKPSPIGAVDGPRANRRRRRGAMGECGGRQAMLMAKTDFTPLENADDPDETILPADYRDMLATLTVAWSSFAEAKYPEEPERTQTWCGGC